MFYLYHINLKLFKSPLFEIQVIWKTFITRMELIIVIKGNDLDFEKYELNFFVRNFPYISKKPAMMITRLSEMGGTPSPPQKKLK